MESTNKNTKPSTIPKSTLLGDLPILKSILKKSVHSGINTSTKSHDEVLSVGQQDEVEETSLLSGLAAKLRNVDGKIVGRDGKVLKPYRSVKFADQEDVVSKNQNKEDVIDHGTLVGNVKTACGSTKDAVYLFFLTFPDGFHDLLLFA